MNRKSVDEEERIEALQQINKILYGKRMEPWRPRKKRIKRS